MASLRVRHIPVLWIPILLFAIELSAADGRASLAERLGYRSDQKLLVINGDDAGMCHTANQATIGCLETGLMTTATIMVPCPWFPEIAAYARQHPEKDFGAHLTHTCEWKLYRWGPVAGRDRVPGLVDPDGYIWPSVEEVYAKSTPTEALEEGRAQIKKALAAGVDLTHLDSHMGTLQYDVRYMESYLKLAVEFDLPVRMAGQATLERFQQPGLRDKFAKEGILFPDYFVYEELSEESRDVKGFWLKVLKTLKPGVTELYIHAGKPTEELQTITGSWKTRSAEFDTFTTDPQIREVVAAEKIVRIGYRPLRDLQRKMRKESPAAR